MTEALNVRPKEGCRWDVVSLGEVMLRLDPGEGRVHTTRTFQVWEGGGEYNVARGLKRCFGLDAAVVTACAPRWAVPTAGTPPSRSSSPATSTGSRYSGARARAGSTPAASSARSPR